MKQGLFFLAVVGLVVSSAMGATMTNYGDFTGINMRYQQVTEQAISAGDQVPLYGQPGLTGDTLDFDNLTFASSCNGGASDTTDGKLTCMITAKEHRCITAIAFDEYGDLTLAGTGDALTYATVVNNLYIDVKEIDGEAEDVDTIIVPMEMSPSDGYWDLTGGRLFGQLWEGHLDFDVTAAIRSQGFSTGFATKVEIVMDNILSTGSQTGSNATIAKKMTDGLQITAIPEPMTALLLCLGVGLLRSRRL